MKNEKIKIILAFLAIYIFWGSTYLANKYAIQVIPPFIMTGFRFTIAGSLLLLFLMLKNEPFPSIKNWKNPLIVGGLMLFLGNGFIVLAQKEIPSGLTAILISITPLYIIILNRIINKNNKLKFIELIGILLGTFGVILLFYDNINQNITGGNLLSMFIILLSSFAWASGALYSKYKSKESDSFMPIAQQMICGGLLLFLLATIKNEWSELNIANISKESVLSVLYLIVFGSLIGYSSYIWLLKRCNPSLVSTNTFINPIIALVLGTIIANEPLSVHIVIASIVIITSLIIITVSHIKE
jgi:drug/metabolite transporter (DMT)-like permease